MALREPRLVSYLLRALPLELIFSKYHICLEKLICASCRFEAGYGMLISSEVLPAELLVPLGTMSGTGQTCLPASCCLASVRLCGGLHLPCHPQLFL